MFVIFVIHVCTAAAFSGKSMSRHDLFILCVHVLLASPLSPSVYQRLNRTAIIAGLIFTMNIK